VSGHQDLGTVRQRDLLARLWTVVDPALDVLPADELLERVLTALEEAFGAAAAAVELTSGERVGTPEDDAAWSRGPRLELPLHDARDEVGRLEIALPDGLADEEERFALRLAATRLGRAVARGRQELEAARVQQRLRADALAIEHLYRIAGALMAQRGLEDVVQYVTDEATEIVAAQFGAFFYNVLDDTGGSYMLYTLSGVPREAFSRFPMPRNTDVFAPTFAGEGVVRSDDITRDPRYGRNAPRHGMPEGHLPVRSYLAVPVKARDGEVLGGLFFGHSAVGVFDAEAERLVVGVAALAALAIENARLHDTAQRELAASRRAYHERDTVARVLQESLLPVSLPQVEGLDFAAAYAPGSAIVGGDFYDLFPIGPGTHVAAIGDVQGKDARAAARTSLVRHAVRLAATHAAGPVEALHVVNGATLQDRDDEDPRFSTLLLARVEPSAEGVRVQLASAGHPPALVLRRDGVVEALDCPGTLLGIVDDPEFRDCAVVLAPGDAIVLYTDGLTEARRERGILGEARVKELLAGLAGQDAQGIATGLEEASLAWSQGARADDLALLVLRAP
jgi:serine phosphatase RsbU (regulator of sigma subunit)